MVIELQALGLRFHDQPHASSLNRYHGCRHGVVLPPVLIEEGQRDIAGLNRARLGFGSRLDQRSHGLAVTRTLELDSKQVEEGRPDVYVSNLAVDHDSFVKVKS